MATNIYESRVHTIAVLRLWAEVRLPYAWRVLALESGFELQFTFDSPDFGYWLPVSLRSGSSKVYKSLDAVYSDIRRVVGSVNFSVEFIS